MNDGSDRMPDRVHGGGLPQQGIEAAGGETPYGSVFDPTRRQWAGRLDVRKWDKPSLKDHHVVSFRCKLWNEHLSSLDVHLRNKAGKGAMQDLALCTLCNEKVLGDAWHTIGLCPHPGLQEARALATVTLRAAIRAIKLPGLRRHIFSALNTAADGAWVFDRWALGPIHGWANYRTAGSRGRG